MQEFEEDLYAILGVEETASGEEIRKAYLSLAKKLHPDRHPNDPEQRAVAQREFAKVTRAHDIVGDAERRAEYDALRTLTKKRISQQNLEIEDEPSEASMKPAPAHAAPASGATFSQSNRSQSQPLTPEEENINTKWANKHLSRADELFRRKNYKEAETAMKEAIRLVPTEPRYHNKLAEIYLARGWRTLAMTEVQASLRVDPKNADAKTLEARIKALTREVGANTPKQKKGFFQTLKEILTKKL